MDKMRKTLGDLREGQDPIIPEELKDPTSFEEFVEEVYSALENDDFDVRREDMVDIGGRVGTIRTASVPTTPSVVGDSDFLEVEVLAKRGSDFTTLESEMIRHGLEFEGMGFEDVGLEVMGVYRIERGVYGSMKRVVDILHGRGLPISLGSSYVSAAMGVGDVVNRKGDPNQKGTITEIDPATGKVKVQWEGEPAPTEADSQYLERRTGT